MSEVKEVLRWQLKGFIPGVEGVSKAELKPWVVLASDFDALAQQLAASEARVAELIEAFAESQDSLVVRGIELTARDKRLEEAVWLLRQLESVDAAEPYCPVCFSLKDYGHDEHCKLRAFLSQSDEAKENGE